jgi:hypothetical protein
MNRSSSNILLAAAIVLGLHGCRDQTTPTELADAEPVAPSFIQGGKLDGDRHPQVCAIVANIGSPTGALVERGSAVLVAPDVLITAGHAAIVSPFPLFFNSRVTCEAEALTSTQRIPYDGVPHPLFNNSTYEQERLAGLDNHDLGVLLLHAPISDVKVAKIPKIGFTDENANNCDDGDDNDGDDVGCVTVVGYGAEVNGLPGQVNSYSWPGRGTRRNVQSPFVALTPFYVSYAVHGCPGDSGGPALKGRTVMGTMTSTDEARPFCSVTGPAVVSFFSRWDTASAQEFLSQFVDLNRKHVEENDD